MNIVKYDFHDGCIIDIDQIGNNIQILMESVQIPPNEITCSISLSNFSTLKGKLHLDDISNILENDEPVKFISKKGYDAGYIFDFDIKDNRCFLTVSWKDYPPSRRESTDVFRYEITAKQIYWENLPHLIDPFERSITSYTLYFQSGRIYDIHYDDDQISIGMESAKIDPDKNINNCFSLSKKTSLMGELVLDWVKYIKINGSPCLKSFDLKFNDGQILNFDIGDHRVILDIFHRKSLKNEHMHIEIETGSVYWRNLPNQ